MDNYYLQDMGVMPKNTSRNVFHCFIDTLFHSDDPAVGGPPQLAGIYRKPGSAAHYYGVIHNQRRYFLGSEIPYESEYDAVEWRNERFERYSGEEMRRLAAAAVHPDTLRRG